MEQYIKEEIKNKFKNIKLYVQSMDKVGTLKRFRKQIQKTIRFRKQFREMNEKDQEKKINRESTII